MLTRQDKDICFNNFNFIQQGFNIGRPKHVHHKQS